jgi:hypothetical protein
MVGRPCSPSRAADGMTAPAFEARAAAYLRTAKVEPDAEAAAVLALPSAYAAAKPVMAKPRSCSGYPCVAMLRGNFLAIRRAMLRSKRACPNVADGRRSRSYAHLTTEYAPRRYSRCTIRIKRLTAAAALYAASRVFQTRRSVNSIRKPEYAHAPGLEPPSELQLRTARQPLMSPRQNHKWAAECDARVRELYAEGRSWAEIGTAIGVTAASAKAHGRRLGLYRRALQGPALEPSSEAATPPDPPETATPPVPLQQLPEAATGPVPPHLEIIARSKPPQRSEGGHPLPAGDPLSWALLLSHTPALGNPTWPKREIA